jgi:hypothetical protein
VVHPQLSHADRQRFLTEIGDDIVTWLLTASNLQRRRFLLKTAIIDDIIAWLTALDANKWKNAYYAIDQLRARKAQADREDA